MQALGWAVSGDWRGRPVGEHFRLGEFVTWNTGRGPHREPPPEVEREIRGLVSTMLDPLRRELGRPVRVASGWRPADIFLTGGRTSAHTLGAGADIRVDGMTPDELAREIDRLIRAGKIRQGGVGVYPPGFPAEGGEIRAAWDPTVHVDTGAHVTRHVKRRWPLAWWA